MSFHSSLIRNLTSSQASAVALQPFQMPQPSLVARETRPAGPLGMGATSQLTFSGMLLVWVIRARIQEPSSIMA